MTLALTMATPWNAAHPAPQRAPDARADPSENQAPDGVAERWNNYDAFQLFNSCKPIGAGVSWSGRGHEDMESNLTQLVESRLRLARLLNTDPNWSSDWLFIHVEYEQPWVFVNLEFHKTVRDEATGHTDHAATYTLQHVGLGETNAGIRQTVDAAIDKLDSRGHWWWLRESALWQTPAILSEDEQLAVVINELADPDHPEHSGTSVITKTLGRCRRPPSA